MMLKTKIFLLLAVSSITSPAFCQSEDKLGSWYIYNGFFKFSPKFEILFDSQIRNYEVASNAETFLIRPYFTYNINKNLQPSVGFEYLKAWSYDDVPEDKVSLEEFRISTQFIITQKVNRLGIQHRYRYEFRFIEGNPLQRMRYRLQVTIPITSESISKGSFFANSYLESFITTKPTLEFNQIWLYLAGGYQFTDNLNFQLGYMAIFHENATYSRLQFWLTQKIWFYDNK